MTGFTRLALSWLVASSLAAACAAPESEVHQSAARDSTYDHASIYHLKHNAHRHHRIASLLRRADAEPKPARCEPRKRARAAAAGGGGTGGAAPSVPKKKAGLAWNMGKISSQNQFWGSKVSWCYSWSAWSCSDHLEFVPMMWGNKQDAINGWKSQVMGKHWKYILAFNEPDHPGQATMSPDAAVTMWNQYIKPVNADFYGAPAVTNSQRGLDWLASFLKKCTGCKIDFVPAHYYGLNFESFKAAVTRVHDVSGGRPVWVTEWACQNFGDPKYGECDLGEVKAFLKQTQEWMDNTSWITRYSWFGTLNDMGNVDWDNAMLKNGKITDLGKQYIN